MSTTQHSRCRRQRVIRAPRHWSRARRSRCSLAAAGAPAARAPRRSRPTAAAQGHRRRGRRPRRHRVGRVHRPARGREHRRGPAARVRLRLRRPLQRRRLVQQGDLLFQIDPRPFQAEVDRLRAELARARATVQRADSELQRAERLRAENAMSREEHDRRAVVRRRKSTAQVAAVEAALRAAELNLEFTRVTAPIDGRVGRAIVTEGNLVSSGPGEATLLTTRGVARSDLRARSTPTSRPSCATATWRAKARAPARGSRRCRSAWRSPATTDFPREGKLELPRQPARSGDRHDPRPRDLPNPDRRPDAGPVRAPAAAGQRRYQGAADSGPRGRHRPRQALRARRRRATSTVEYRAVTLGPLVDGLRVVRSGLAAGDLVVVNGLQRVRPGVKVEPVAVAMDRARRRSRRRRPATPRRQEVRRHEVLAVLHRPADLRGRALAGHRHRPARSRCSGCRSANIPSVVPPTVVVRGVYPGANPKVIAETVAAPLEQQINGVEGMLYMFSQSTADGRMTLTVTFALGTDLDNAQVQVQNRVAQALPRLPHEVQRIGVTTEKASPDLMMVVHLVSPDERYDMLYLSNFAHLQVKDELARIAGVGGVQVFGAGEYSMRVWLDPDRLAARQLTATDVVRAIREQNVQVAAGVLGAPPAPIDTTFQLLDQRPGPADHRGAVRRHRRARDAGRPDHPAARRRPRRARREPVRAAQPARQPAGGRDRHLAAARLERARGVDAGARDDGAAEAVVSRRASTTASSTTRRSSSASRSARSSRRCSRRSCWSSSS